MSLDDTKEDLVGPDLQSSSLPAGTTLLDGQYTIDSYLSSGGFGITYLAHDSLNRQVVIKECYPEALCGRSRKTVMARTTAHQGEFHSLLEMFVREARNLAQLRHPHIVGVHQVFESYGTAYMVLDLIQGEDLLALMANENAVYTPGKVKKLLLKLLDAVATIHDNDMLHRDISPDNVLVDVWGNPVLIDFGAAREQASKKSRAISALMVVKDGYSPQEFYLSGSRQEASSDLYSLAATFYHLITGEAPVNSQARLAAIASKRPDPCEPLAGRIQGYDTEFLRAIDQAMNVFPADRIQSAREWVTMIDSEKRRAAAQQESKDNAELQKVIAEMVVEVEESIAQSVTREKEAAAPPPPQEKPLEYLSPPDETTAYAEPELVEGPEVAPTRMQRFRRWLIYKICAPLRSRPLGIAAVAMALCFNISQSPDSNVMTAAMPEMQKLYEMGREFTTKTADTLIASL